ncbi:YibE/F family protein [Candidatus Kaiserbacteria bacterium]|nr:MAG: YibE/F family protein [Candidatus Kaiserbacteria bacterium]
MIINKVYIQTTLFVILLCIVFQAQITSAQVLQEDVQGVWRATVTEVLKEESVVVPGTDVKSTVQTISVELIEGERSGEVITFENDYIQLDEGDTFYLNYLITINETEFYSVREVDRRIQIGFIVALFIAVIVLFGGMQGFRSLLSLAGSLLVILFILVPTLVKGYSPIPISVFVASLVLFFAVFFTHGFNKRSAVAFVGTVIAVAITGILAYFSVEITSLTGFSSDESTYLNLNTGGQLDFVGLLLAGIIIGALGVLDDIAITQVAVVRELFSSGSKLTKWDVYRKALRVGREHVGALVNTLVLAYTGAALPLLLLFSFSESSMLNIINTEVFATEILRALVGSIGLVSAVPITTFLAVHFLSSLGKGVLEAQESTHSHI